MAPRTVEAGTHFPCMWPQSASVWMPFFVWIQEILGLDAMPSMDVNFFELGGHSLSAMQLQRVLETGSERGRGSRRLSLREVFQHPTVAGLAKLLAEEGPFCFSFLLRISLRITPRAFSLHQENHTDSHHSPREKPPLLSGHSRENDGGGLPASFAQERLWLEQHLLPGDGTSPSHLKWCEMSRTCHHGELTLGSANGET